MAWAFLAGVLQLTTFSFTGAPVILAVLLILAAVAWAFNK
jgi:hypothetical protein